MATTPTGPQFCSQNDVELAIGGVAILAQLLDKNGDGIADADLVTSIIAKASAEVASAVQVQYALTSLTVPYPDELVHKTANLGAYYAWTMGSSEIVMPDGAKALYDDALRWLDQVARRERAIGAATQPAGGTDVKQIDTNPNGDRTTRDSMIGFW